MERYISIPRPGPTIDLNARDMVVEIIFSASTLKMDIETYRSSNYYVSMHAPQRVARLVSTRYPCNALTVLRPLLSTTVEVVTIVTISNCRSRSEAISLHGS